MRTAPAVLIVSALATSLTACGGHTTAPSPPAGSAGSAAPPASQATSQGASGSGSRDIAENVMMTGPVRHQLVVAAAAQKNVPPHDYVGLSPQQRHYAYDLTTQTYWAAASLVPRSSSTAAQVSVQDAGSYDLFERHKGGRWRAFESGAAGGSPCAVEVPAAVATRWGWPGPGCRPPAPS